MNSENPVDLKGVNFEWAAYMENFLRGEPHTVANVEHWIGKTGAAIDAETAHTRALVQTLERAFGNPPILKASAIEQQLDKNYSIHSML